MSAKAALLEKVRISLRQQLERLQAAATEAHAAATDPDSKAESKYDTRSLEASYLASGQARQLQAMREDLERLASFEAGDLAPDDPIAAGALVEIDLDGETSWYFLLPGGGGHTIEDEGREITLLSPSSLLYQQLCDLRVGETVAQTGHLVTEVA